MIRSYLLTRLTYLHEIGEAFGNVVKELGSRTNHNSLWNGVNLGLHLKFIVAFQVDQQYSEVCAAEIKGQELALLWKTKQNRVSTSLCLGQSFFPSRDSRIISASGF